MESTGDRESTAALLTRVRAGDADARERLLARYLPLLQRWAHGRLPPRARRLADTDDLVQETLLRALHGMEHFELRHEGAFLAYVRKILLNELRSTLHRANLQAPLQTLSESLQGAPRSPMEQAIGAEALEAYEAALASLPDEQQQAVLLRIELGFSFQQIADATDSPSADAARMRVSRALARLSEKMVEHAH